MSSHGLKELTSAWLHDFAEAVGRSLHGWQVRTNEVGWVFLVGHDGARIQVQQARSSQPRVQLQGIYPQSRYYYLPGESAPSITVAATRHPRDVATDLTRRLLPTYLHVLGKVRLELAADAKDDERRDAVAQRLAGLIPGAFVRVAGRNPGVADHETEVRWYDQGIGLVSGMVRMWGDAEGATVKINSMTTVALEQLLSAFHIPSWPSRPTRANQDAAAG